MNNSDVYIYKKINNCIMAFVILMKDYLHNVVTLTDQT